MTTRQPDADTIMGEVNPMNDQLKPNEREYDFDVTYTAPEKWLGEFSFVCESGSSS